MSNTPASCDNRQQPGPLLLRQQPCGREEKGGLLYTKPSVLTTVHCTVHKQGPLDLWLLRETTKIKVWIFSIRIWQKKYFRKGQNKDKVKPNDPHPCSWSSKMDDDPKNGR